MDGEETRLRVCREQWKRPRFAENWTNEWPLVVRRSQTILARFPVEVHVVRKPLIISGSAETGAPDD